MHPFLRGDKSVTACAVNTMTSFANGNRRSALNINAGALVAKDTDDFCGPGNACSDLFLRRWRVHGKKKEALAREQLSSTSL